MPSTHQVTIVIELLLSITGLVIILLTILAGLGLIMFALIGLLTFYHLTRSKRAPADTSNRINHIRLWWFALTREDKFVGQFPWLAKDEWENIHSSKTQQF